MGETRRKFDHDFQEGAVRLVRETGKPIAQVVRDLGINEGTLGNWVNADKRRRGEGNGATAMLTPVPFLGQQLVGVHPAGVFVGDRGNDQLVGPCCVAQVLELVGNLPW